MQCVSTLTSEVFCSSSSRVFLLCSISFNITCQERQEIKCRSVSLSLPWPGETRLHNRGNTSICPLSSFAYHRRVSLVWSYYTLLGSAQWLLWLKKFEVAMLNSFTKLHCWYYLCQTLYPHSAISILHGIFYCYEKSWMCVWHGYNIPH